MKDKEILVKKSFLDKVSLQATNAFVGYGSLRKRLDSLEKFVATNMIIKDLPIKHVSSILGKFEIESNPNEFKEDLISLFEHHGVKNAQITYIRPKNN